MTLRGSVVGALAMVSLGVGCGGGRTAPHSAAPATGPCSRSGHENLCHDVCGQGVQVCKNGLWQACEVPPVDRACSTACGPGLEICRAGTWSECTVPIATETCSGACGAGKRTCQNGVWSECDAAQPKAGRLNATLRDFHQTHPDFERPGTGDLSELGLVLPLLGSDDTPTYAHAGGTTTVTGPETFAQWYHDVPGVNVSIPYQIQLQPSTSQPGFYAFASTDFFPLDGDPRGFGIEEFDHDFDFTLATKFTFRYVGGEVFRFIGDDDLWVFVNRHLAIDLGGLHQSKMGEVYLDDHAADFGLVRGNAYAIHLFFAERHAINSDFSIETTIADPASCD